MFNNKDKEYAYRELYRVFEDSLSKPSRDSIASSIFNNNDCNDLQSNNNYSFLRKIEEAVNDYTNSLKLSFENINELEAVDCDLNNFVMSTFINIARDFESDPNIKTSLISSALEEYSIEERNRLLDFNLLEITRVMMYKSLAYLSFNLGLYEISFKHHEAAVLIFGSLTSKIHFDDKGYIEEVVSSIGKKGAEARWSKHNQTRPEKKRKYLQIMDQHNFTTYSETAEYIKQNIETGKTPTYETIKRWLAQARKGDFS